MSNFNFAQINFWEMTCRSIITFLVLLVLGRFLGKKQMSHMTFFNYITGITIGSIAAEIAGENNTSFWNGIVSMMWWVVLTFLVGLIGLKSSRARVLLDDQPTIIIKDGKIQTEALRANQLNLDDVSMMLREHSIFSMKDVLYAIFEPNGKLSILKKGDQQTVKKGDLHIATEVVSYLPAEIITDGKIVKKNLVEYNLNEEWVYNQLKKNGIKSIQEVFYAEIQSDGSLFIQKA